MAYRVATSPALYFRNAYYAVQRLRLSSSLSIATVGNIYLETLDQKIEFIAICILFTESKMFKNE